MPSLPVVTPIMRRRMEWMIGHFELAIDYLRTNRQDLPDHTRARLLATLGREVDGLRSDLRDARQV